MYINVPIIPLIYIRNTKVLTHPRLSQIQIPHWQPLGLKHTHIVMFTFAPNE